MLVTPTSLNATGEALVPAGDRTLPMRIVGGIPGELAEVRVTHKGSNFITAEWVSAADPSTDRVDPRCEHVHRCGGCPWLHIARPRAHDERTERVRGIFTAAGVHFPVEARTGPDRSARHVVKLVAVDMPASRDGSRVRFGAYRPRSHEVTSIPGCLALAPGLRRLTDLHPLSLPPGLVRHLIARQSSVDGKILATLVVRNDHPALRKLEPVLRAAGVSGLALHENDQPGDGILDPKGRTASLWGIPTLKERTAKDGAEIAVGPTDFFQTNPDVGRQIWADLPAAGGPVVDLYAGVGTVALAMWSRERAIRVFGVEENRPAAARAGENARALGADATFVSGVAGEVSVPPEFSGGTVVLNPPRKGTTAAVRAQVAGLEPRRIVYISCHPEPLARDLAEWVGAGFEVESARTYDMFPGTPHVETVVVLRR